MIQSLGYTLAALGGAYLAALLMDRLMTRLHIPKVTGYLLVGLILGPILPLLSGLPAILNPDRLDHLSMLSDIALAMIMVSIGGQFQSRSLKRSGRGLLIHSAVETAMTFLLVSVSAFLILLVWGYSQLPAGLSQWSGAAQMSLFLGILAVATAPAATLLVVREYESEGPVTDLVLALVGLNNLISILAFDISGHYLLGLGSSLVITLFAPLALGGIVGFGVSVWGQWLETLRDMKLLFLGAIILTVGLCSLLHLDLFLCSFAMGITITNASPKNKDIFEAAHRVDYPFYVIFFVTAGAGLHIEALTHLGILGLAYVAMRTIGKLLGSAFGARWAGLDRNSQRNVGQTLLAQAGVTIGLAYTLKVNWPEGGSLIEPLILGSVVLFELIGPLTVRRGLIQAGEVPLLTLLAKRAPETTFEGLHHVVEHFRMALDIPVGHRVKSPTDIFVKHVMRKNVETIRQDTRFNSLLNRISHSKYDRFPVTDQNDNFIGVIDYQDIRDILFDKSLANLIVAKDMVKPVPLVLYGDQTLGEALTFFQVNSDITYVPVVARDNPKKLLGMITQNDILATFRKQDGSAEQSD